MNKLSQNGAHRGLRVLSNQTGGASAPPPHAAGPITIFIAEDDSLARHTLRQGLEKVFGFQVVGESDNGVDAVAQIRALKPTVALIKNVLPELSGLHAIQSIRLDCPQTRVIILSCQNDESEIYASFNAGANGYCVKGSSAKHLIMAIQSVSEGTGWVDPVFSKRSFNVQNNPSSAAINKAAAGESPLSEREMDVLRLIAEGLSNHEIAARLIVSTETIKTHVRHIMEKLAASDRTLAVVTALRKGWVK